MSFPTFETNNGVGCITAAGDRKIGLGESGISIEFDIGTANPKNFTITKDGFNFVDTSNNHITPLERIALIQQAFQSVELPPDATTLKINNRLLLTDNTSACSIDIVGVNTQIDSSGNLILKTGNTDRLTIANTGSMTFQGGMGYNNTTDTLTATNFTGTSSRVSLANNNTAGTFFPVFSTGSGSQDLFVDNVTGPFSVNPSTGDMRIANTFKLDDGRVAVGTNAGASGQLPAAVAIGSGAGSSNQGQNSVAIGIASATNNQGTACVAIGESAGNISQANRAIAIGPNSGLNNQGTNAIAIGNSAASGATGSGQGQQAIAIGRASGQLVQGQNAVAIGNEAGQNNQGQNSICIGPLAGKGVSSGIGANSIAIGHQTGVASQVANSICLNASGFQLDPAVAGCFIRPIRGITAGSTFTPPLPANVLYYNPVTFEILRTT